MGGTIRFTMVITSAHAYAYRATCLAQHIPGHRVPKLPAAQAEARSPKIHNAHSTTRVRGNDYRGKAIYTDSGTS